MTPQRWEKIKEIFSSALEIAPEVRPDYVERACGGDAELHSEVLRLLHEYDDSEDFLETVPLEINVTFAAGDLVAGRYRIAKMLGRGGMGEVYEAEDERLGELVAIKTLRADLARDAAATRRFQKELQLARRGTHWCA